jgi:hypothetical protein
LEALSVGTSGEDEEGTGQPPKPQIQPSEQVLERAASRDASMEAAG